MASQLDSFQKHYTSNREAILWYTRKGTRVSDDTPIIVGSEWLGIKYI